jgi:hypothetical protein
MSAHKMDSNFLPEDHGGLRIELLKLKHKCLLSTLFFKPFFRKEYGGGSPYIF